MANYDLLYEGSEVQDILDTGKSLEDDGYIFLGAATPSTIPGTPTERVAYVGGPGTYNNFGTTVVVPSGSIVVITYSGSAWSKTVINASLPVSTTLENNDTTIPTGKAVKTAIDAEATARGDTDTTLQNAITAEATARGAADTALQNAITAINTKLGEGYVYAGIATTTTNPGTPTGKVFYIATAAGTYTNFGGLVVTQGINILKYNGTAWSSEQVFGVDDVPTAGSNNLVKSGGVALVTKYNGGTICLASEVTESVVSALVGSGTTSITIGRMLFNKRNVEGSTASYYYPQSATLQIPQTANYVTIGLIFDPTVDNPSAARYGYYSSTGLVSEMTNQEKFEPILVCRVIDNTYYMISGMVYDAIRLGKMNKLFPYECGGNITLISVFNDELISYEVDPQDNTRMLLTLSRLIFTLKSSDRNYLDLASETLSVPIDGNFLTIGVIHKLEPSRFTNKYGFYCTGSSEHTTINSDEIFEPICTFGQITSVTSKPTIRGGILFDYQQSVLQNVRANKNIVGGMSLIASSVSKSDISISKSGSTVTITMPRIIFGSRSSNTAARQYLYPESATFEINADANFVVIGLIYKRGANADFTTSRYGYYSGNNGYATTMDADEVFEPILTIVGFSSTPQIWSGQLYDFVTIKDSNNRIEALENNAYKSSRNLVYENDFKTIEGLGTIDQNQDTAVPSDSLTISNGYLMVAQNRTFWPCINCRINRQTCRILFNTSTAQGFDVVAYAMEDGYNGAITEVLLGLDFSNNNIKVRGATDISFTFQQNRDYIIEISRYDRRDIMSIVDVVTGIRTQIYTFNGANSFDGLLYDVIAIRNTYSTSPKFSRYTIHSDVSEPYLMMYGDSITVGFSSSITNGLYENSYATLIGTQIDKPYLASGRGGGTYVGLLGGTDAHGFRYVGRLDLELAALRPKYVMVTIGTNGGTSYAYFKSIVEKIISYGACPIINKIPIRLSDGVVPSYYTSTNEAVSQIWKDYNIHGLRFDIATSVNGDCVTFDSSKFVEDNIHPNNTGHAAMAGRLTVDYPELLS